MAGTAGAVVLLRSRCPLDGGYGGLFDVEGFLGGAFVSFAPAAGREVWYFGHGGLPAALIFLLLHTAYRLITGRGGLLMLRGFWDAPLRPLPRLLGARFGTLAMFPSSLIFLWSRFKEFYHFHIAGRNQS